MLTRGLWHHRCMLEPYRILDLTDHRGEIGPMILGDLGADVIRIEPPGGSEARRRGPMIDDAPPDLSSLQFHAFNRNKRSICLDLTSDQGRETLLELVRGADIVVESSPPGALRGNGITFETLKSVNPRIVHVLVTPFGADGPAADRVANDLTLSALGGQAALQGLPGRAPVRVTVPQIYRHTGAEAAAAAVIALTRMHVTGDAQFVDLSAQCSATWTTMNAMDAYAIQGFDFQRMGSTVQMGTAAIDPVMACADGFMVAIPMPATLEPLLAHMLGDEVIDASWLGEDWATYAVRLMGGEAVGFSLEEVRDAFERFFLKHTKSELFAIGLESGVTLAPINNVSDLLDFPQLRAREAWAELTLPGGKVVRTPGIFARASQSPLAIRRTAPLPGEHDAEIATELQSGGRSRAAVPAPKPGVAAPFAGVKVLDLTWVIAGPASVRYFSDHGADVIKVESELRPDGLRHLGPVRGELPLGWNQSQFYGEFNAGKRCVQLNLKHPDALGLLQKLIKWADVLIENWAPGATERLGIHYEANCHLNPNLIMLSTSLMGQTGPAKNVAGYGYHAGGMAGFYEVTGYADSPPLGPWLAYTDVIAPHFIATLVTAALDYRRRTGEGQHIDASQFEMALQFLAPEILDCQANGYIATRLGNRAADRAPQGIYPSAGEDAWCAIAIETDAEWVALVSALGNPGWAVDERLADHKGRLEHHDSIDHHLAEWTKARTPQEAMDFLTSQGVPAGALQRSSDLATDPQYKHRGFHKVHEHPVMGSVPYAGNQFRIPGYNAGPHGPAPLLGEHNHEVLREICGLTSSEVDAAIADGLIQ